MRKTHWEQVKKHQVIELSIRIMERTIKATNGMHKHADDFWHIDCVQDHVKGLVPKVFLGNGDNLMMSPLRSLLFYCLFKRSGEPLYRMAAAFAEELRQTKMKIPARVIPADNKVVCIEFPEGCKYQCVYIGCAEGIGSDSRGPVYKRIEFQFMYELGAEDKFDRYTMHFYSEDEDIDDAANLLRESYPNFPIALDEIKFALNCFLYIHSGKPDLRDYRPPKRPLTRKPKEQRRYDKMMLGMDEVPVILVGYGFNKETQVGAHLQRYWTGRGRTDLIWVYKNPYVKGGE